MKDTYRYSLNNIAYLAIGVDDIMRDLDGYKLDISRSARMRGKAPLGLMLKGIWPESLVRY